MILDNQFTSANAIANAAHQPLDDVIVDLNAMINLGYFNNMELDVKNPDSTYGHPVNAVHYNHYTENERNANENEASFTPVNFPVKQSSSAFKSAAIGLIAALTILLTIFVFATFSESIQSDIKFNAAEQYDTQATVLSKWKKSSSSYVTFFMSDQETELDWYVDSKIYDKISEGDTGVL